MRADHDVRRAAVVEPATVGLLHQDAALDVRVGADVDVASDRLQPPADVRGIQRDVPVDVGHMAAHVGAPGQLDSPVDRLDFAVDLGVAAQFDAAIDRVERTDGGAFAQGDPAIDRVGLACASAVGKGNVAIDGAEFAGTLTGGDADVAVDLVDIEVRGDRRQRQGQGEGDEQVAHGGA